MENTNCFHS
ncbi:hypothetical protein MTR67_038578 [Solanum verrucosum]|uniref:Uncharacterized protein n=1 Tax=Solanum verrucosum TaxID=315347 RepID=A0AAF0UG44_SOLVR|nr:hypothetical protein MTR67_038578 [Solanum verrucosum]